MGFPWSECQEISAGTYNSDRCGRSAGMPGSVNLTASHCTNYICVCKKRGSQTCDMSSEDGTFVGTGMTHTDKCTVTTCRTIIL